MAAQKRFLALTLAVVALGLSVVGVVLAATDDNSGGLTKDPLALNGYAPRSANLLVTLSTGADFGLSANVTVNFKTNEVEGIVRFPLVVSNAAIELRLLKSRLYARSANETNGPWLDAAVKTPPLFGYALELTKPDIRLITGFHQSLTTSGYDTTYVFTRDHVALTSVFGTSTAPTTLGSLRWSITVGAQGEVSSSTLAVSAKNRTTTLSVTVLSYNSPATIAAPSNVRPISLSAVRTILGTQDFASLLFPRDLSSLSGSSVS